MSHNVATGKEGCCRVQQQRQLKQRRKAELTEYHGAAQLVSAGRCGGELQGSFC